jgi:hypothetical protein
MRQLLSKYSLIECVEAQPTGRLFNGSVDSWCHVLEGVCARGIGCGRSDHGCNVLADERDGGGSVRISDNSLVALDRAVRDNGSTHRFVSSGAEYTGTCTYLVMLAVSVGQSVRSSARAVGAFVSTDRIPLSRAPFEEYISLRPIGSPLRALSTKYGSGAVDVRRSNRAAMVAFCRTERRRLRRSDTDPRPHYR